MEGTINGIGGDITSHIAHRVFRTYSADRVNRLHCVVVSLLHTAMLHAEAERKEREAKEAPIVTIRTCYDTADTLLFEVCLQFGLAPTMLREHRSGVVQQVARAYRASDVIDGATYLVLQGALIEMHLLANDTKRFNATFEIRGKRKDLIGY